MPRTDLCMILGLGVSVLSAASTPAQTVPAKPVDSKINWVYSYEEGKKLSQKTGKPLFVLFRCER